jgi:hypothetical protein
MLYIYTMQNIIYRYECEYTDGHVSPLYTKGVVRRHNSKKGRQCNGQNKDKIKQWSTNTTQKTKEWTP